MHFTQLPFQGIYKLEKRATDYRLVLLLSELLQASLKPGISSILWIFP